MHLSNSFNLTEVFSTTQSVCLGLCKQRLDKLFVARSDRFISNTNYGLELDDLLLSAYIL
jgi:hypothetical protein